jgi:polysaccharide chain length determinant protein (PEP-CTERM system associated)
MLPGKKFTLADAKRLVLQRAWMVVLPTSIGLSFAPLISQRTQELFRSETLIMVIPQRVPDTYVKSTVTAKLEDRLPSISNMIQSRSRLERIINDFNLYPESRARGIMEDIVARLRRDINVKMEGPESFRISYVSKHPQIAQKVAARLASLYIEENLRDRENLAEETNLFLESQLADAKQRLIEHETKLKTYQMRYAGQLPSQLESNLQTIQSAQMQLQTIGESLNRIRERRLLVQRQLADAQSPSPVMTQAVTAGESGGATPAPLSTGEQLEQAKAQLELFRLRYTPGHPDVRTLERTVSDLQARIREEASKPAGDAPREVSAPERARLKRIAEFKADLDLLDHQLAANQAEESKLKQRMSDYQAKVEVLPTRESELVELTRDYSTLQLAYTSLLSKREDSKIAANLERRQIGEQFRILDPASLPEKPYNRTQRLGIIASGGIAGLVLALALVVFLEVRDCSFKVETDVLAALALPVLAVVPAMPTASERRARRLKIVVANLSAVLATAGSATILVLWRLRH